MRIDLDENAKKVLAENFAERDSLLSPYAAKTIPRFAKESIFPDCTDGSSYAIAKS